MFSWIGFNKQKDANLADSHEPFRFLFWFRKDLLPDEYLFQHLFSPCILRTTCAFFDVQHVGDLFVRITFDRIQVEDGTIAYRQDADTLYDLFCLNDRRYGFLSYLHAMCMHDIQTLIEPFVLFEVVDAGMNDDAPDPTFECTFVLESVHLRKYFYKTFLQHILRIFPVVGETVAYGKHFWTIPIV